MTISDANPVQFWALNQETFNEKEVDGIFQRCFCAPWNCDDEIIDQFTDETGLTFMLIGVDSDGVVLFGENYSEISTGVYQISVTPNDFDLCDTQIQFKRTVDTTLTRLIAPTGWTDTISTFDQKNGAEFIETVAATEHIQSYQNASIASEITVSFYIQIRATIFPSGTLLGDFVVRFFAADGSGTPVSDISTTTITTSLTDYTDYLVTFTTTSAASRLYIDVTGQVTGLPVDVTIRIPTDQIIYFDASDIRAKSDCISIKEDHNETVLIEYSSNRNFAGLNYSNVTPDPSFFLRVPAVFFRNRFPQEKEVIELSNSRSIQLSAQVKAQKHLQVKNMPDYMHRKLLLALSHQFVTIDGQDWVLSEEYELIPPSNPRWPMQKAQCWLTEKDYIMRSIL